MSIPRPATSEKPPTIAPSEPSPWGPPRRTRKLNAPYGVSRKVGMPPPPSGRGVGRDLADSEDHELGRLDRGDADEADHAAVVEVVLRHRRPIAANEERLLGRVAEQRPVHPLDEQEVLDRVDDVRPQLRSVGLEDRVLRGPVDRVLEVDEVPADVD